MQRHHRLDDGQPESGGSPEVRRLLSISNPVNKVKSFAYQREKLIAGELLRSYIDNFAVMRAICDRA